MLNTTTYTNEELSTMTNKDLMAVLNQLGGVAPKKASKATLVAGILALQEQAQQDVPKPEETKPEADTPKAEEPKTAKVKEPSKRQTAEASLLVALDDAGVQYSINSDGIMLRDKDNKALARVQVRKEYYQLTASKTFADAHTEFTFEFHAGWNMKYACKVTLDEVINIVNPAPSDEQAPSNAEEQGTDYCEKA